MSKAHLDPARSVIAKFGGVEAVSVITGKHITRVYRWMYPKDRGGTGGLIPQAEARKLLVHAKAARIKAAPADFFPNISIDSAAEEASDAACAGVAA